MMKILKPTFFVLLFSILFSSCAKNWSCECTHVSTEDLQLKTAYTSEIVGTRNYAEDECAVSSGRKDGYSTDCRLK